MQGLCVGMAVSHLDEGERAPDLLLPVSALQSWGVPVGPASAKPAQDASDAVSALVRAQPQVAVDDIYERAMLSWVQVIAAI